MADLDKIISQFHIEGTVSEVKPFGSGLINDTYKVKTAEDAAPDYILQKINHNIFQDVDMLQSNRHRQESSAFHRDGQRQDILHG